MGIIVLKVHLLWNSKIPSLQRCARVSQSDLHCQRSPHQHRQDEFAQQVLVTRTSLSFNSMADTTTSCTTAFPSSLWAHLHASKITQRAEDTLEVWAGITASLSTSYYETGQTRFTKALSEAEASTATHSISVAGTPIQGEVGVVLVRFFLILWWR